MKLLIQQFDLVSVIILAIKIKSLKLPFMNKSFHSTTLRVTPALALLQLQHQANHYRNIIRPRKSFSQNTSRINQQKNFCFSHLQSKLEKERIQAIQKQNKRILKDCTLIFMGKGILQKAQQDYKNTQKILKKTLVSPYKAKEKISQLKQQNKNLQTKIQKLKPLVGDKQTWKRHEVFTNQIIDKLRNKKRSKVYSNQAILQIALNSEKQKVNYMSLFKTLSLERKQIDLKQQIKKNLSLTAKSTRRKIKINRQKQININSELNVQVNNDQSFSKKVQAVKSNQKNKQKTQK